MYENILNNNGLLDSLTNEIFQKIIDEKNRPKEDFTDIIEDSLSDLKFPQVIDLGYDKGWKSGKIKLRGTEIIIDLHPNTRFKDNGKNNQSYLQPLDDYLFREGLKGLCKPRYDSKSGLLYVEISRREGLEKSFDDFVLGHEEGHAMIYLGKMTKLFEEAQKLGLQFYFFNKSDSISSDTSFNRIMYGTGTQSDSEQVFKKESFLSESLANVGGLIALIKKNAEHNLISYVQNQIKNMEKIVYPL